MTGPMRGHLPCFTLFCVPGMRGINQLSLLSVQNPGHFERVLGGQRLPKIMVAILKNTQI